MEKYMKFTMFEKETKDKKYQENPYRAVNFDKDNNGNLICPAGRKFQFKYEQHVRGNQYGRTEEVLDNLCSIQGPLPCINRSIQAEGTFGVMKWDKSYKRAFRKGLESVILEFTLISCGFNLYKYHNRKQRIELAA